MLFVNRRLLSKCMKVEFVLDDTALQTSFRSPSSPFFVEVTPAPFTLWRGGFWRIGRQSPIVVSFFCSSTTPRSKRLQATATMQSRVISLVHMVKLMFFAVAYTLPETSARTPGRTQHSHRCFGKCGTSGLLYRRLRFWTTSTGCTRQIRACSRLTHRIQPNHSFLQWLTTCWKGNLRRPFNGRNTWPFFLHHRHKSQIRCTQDPRVSPTAKSNHVGYFHLW